MKIYFCLIFLILFVPKNGLSGQNADINLTRYINNHRTSVQDDAFKTITNSVTPMMFATPAVMTVVGLISHDPELKKNLTLFAGALAISGVTSGGLKFAINRNRPFEDYPNDITKLSTGGGSSFPSAHTSAAFSTATAISIAYPKWYIIAPAMTWAGLVGYSRVYLGVHYPSDVLAGALIGGGSAFLSNYINKKMWKKPQPQISLAYYYDIEPQ